MHELSIANSLLEAACEEAGRRGAVRITRIDCRIGCLRQVDRDLLAEVFDIARQKTTAQDATLSVTTVGTELDCRQCGKKTELETWQFECPSCGSNEVSLSGGDEIELTSLTMELPDDHRGA
jgi:hydrogenase nickel incorporation protein HypA/HybF